MGSSLSIFHPSLHLTSMTSVRGPDPTPARLVADQATVFSPRGRVPVSLSRRPFDETDGW